jgi:ubiquinone/menaquinone biosynthesis C-methylase UbiE
MSSSPTPDFGRLAETYDDLRPPDAEFLDALIERGSLLEARRVLDVGCGTGSLIAELAARGVRTFGVDTSAEMLEIARRKAPRAGLKLAGAERLPFKDSSFERVTFVLSVHLVDRPRAFAEARRVLTSEGRLAIATFTDGHFELFYLNRFFPSLEAIDRARFPTKVQLHEELTEAAFGEPSFTTFERRLETPREEILRRVRSRHISTLELLPEDEFRAGLAQAERELPGIVRSSREFLIVVSRCNRSGLT